MTVRVPVIELHRAGLSFAGAVTAEPSAEYLTTHLRLFSGNRFCAPIAPGAHLIPTTDPTRRVWTWTVRCSSAQSLRLHNDAFFIFAPAHLHFARVHVAGSPIREKIFSVQEQEWVLLPAAQEDQAAGSRFLDYLALGGAHIFSGADHLVFIIALLLMAESLPQALQVITGFTLAHSLTLGLAVLNIVRPASVVIEALIGFSIAIVALENFFLTIGNETRRGLLRAVAVVLIGIFIAASYRLLQVPLSILLGVGIFSVAYLRLLSDKQDTGQLRWVLACVFGLVHGFGFAGALTELALPTNRLMRALLGFNLGVELGQVGLMLLLWPFLLQLTRLPEPVMRIRVIQASSAVILAVGIFWFATRAIGGE